MCVCGSRCSGPSSAAPRRLADTRMHCRSLQTRVWSAKTRVCRHAWFADTHMHCRSRARCNPHGIAPAGAPGGGGARCPMAVSVCRFTRPLCGYIILHHIILYTALCVNVSISSPRAQAAVHAGPAQRPSLCVWGGGGGEGIRGGWRCGAPWSVGAGGTERRWGRLAGGGAGGACPMLLWLRPRRRRRVFWLARGGGDGGPRHRV